MEDCHQRCGDPCKPGALHLTSRWQDVNCMGPVAMFPWLVGILSTYKRKQLRMSMGNDIFYQ
jgi:hypothetical protein